VRPHSRPFQWSGIEKLTLAPGASTQPVDASGCFGSASAAGQMVCAVRLTNVISRAPAPATAAAEALGDGGVRGGVREAVTALALGVREAVTAFALGVREASTDAVGEACAEFRALPTAPMADAPTWRVSETLLFSR
jgi:hypothetical protein